MAYVFFWVILPATEFYMPTFRNTLFHLHRQIGDHLPAYEDGTDSVPKRQHIKFRRRGNYPKENIQHTEHGENLKSRIKEWYLLCLQYTTTCCYNTHLVTTENNKIFTNGFIGCSGYSKLNPGQYTPSERCNLRGKDNRK
jgi:hypothetical protein